MSICVASDYRINMPNTISYTTHAVIQNSKMDKRYTNGECELEAHLNKGVLTCQQNVNTVAQQVLVQPARQAIQMGVTNISAWIQSIAYFVDYRVMAPRVRRDIQINATSMVVMASIASIVVQHPRALPALRGIQTNVTKDNINALELAEKNRTVCIFAQNTHEARRITVTTVELLHRGNRRVASHVRNSLGGNSTTIALRTGRQRIAPKPSSLRAKAIA
jgi:hypothetical protein